MTKQVQRPAPIFRHQDQNVQREFENVYRLLATTAFLGPYRLHYDEDSDKLCIVRKSQDSKQMSTMLRIDKSGNIEFAGTHSASATLPAKGGD